MTIEQERFEARYAIFADGEHFGQYEDPDEPGTWIYLERAVNDAWFWWRAALSQPASPAPEAMSEEQIKEIVNSASSHCDSSVIVEPDIVDYFVRFTIAALAAPEAPTVEQAIQTLVTALAKSKGWMRDYADSVVRDAIDGTARSSCGIRPPRPRR